MKHILKKNGFTECGVIYLENGDPRDAYTGTIYFKGSSIMLVLTSPTNDSHSL